MESSVIRRTKSHDLTHPLTPVRGRSERLRRELLVRTDTTAAEQVFTTLSRKRWLILGMVVLGGVLAGLAGRARAPLYLATTQIFIDPVGAGARASAANVQEGAVDTTIDDHLTGLTSDANLRNVLVALPKMNRDEAHASPGAIRTKRDSLPEAALALLSKEGASASDLLNRIWLGQKASVATPVAANASALADLKRGLKVGQELRSTIITIGFADRDPARAAQIANTVAQVYIDHLTQQNRTSDELELDTILARLPETRRELANATKQFEAYRLTHGADDQGSADQTAQDIAQLSRQLSLAKADLAAAETRLQNVQNLRKTSAPTTLLAKAIGSPMLTDFAIHGTGGAGGDGAPAAENRPDQRPMAPDEINQAIARLDAEARTYRAQVASLEERSVALNSAAIDVVSRVSGLRALELQVGVMSQLYSGLLTRQQELVQRIASPAPGLSILSPAWPPPRPETLSSIFLVPPGMIVFGLMGAVFVVVRRRFDRTLRSEAEAAGALGIPCLGLLPKIARPQPARFRRLLLEQPKAAYTRAVASLLVSLATADATFRLPNVILVTSSIRGEGKTALAWSLALTATRLGERVLFLDLDQRRARMTCKFREKFGAVPASRTFADFVNRTCNLSDAAQEMQEIGLGVMPAPPISCDLLALLSRADAPELVDQLRRAYSVIIIDGPSGLEGPESSLLAGWADAVLFAVRWGKTPLNMACTALEFVRCEKESRPRDRAVLIGSVLTQVNLKQHVRYRFGDSGELLLASP